MEFIYILHKYNYNYNYTHMTALTKENIKQKICWLGVGVGQILYSLVRMSSTSMTKVTAAKTRMMHILRFLR